MKAFSKLILSGMLAVNLPVLAQTINWTGGGDGVSWNSPLNWSGGAVPGPANDVVIAGGAGTNVVISSGSISVKSIQCTKALTISGGSFAVTSGASQVSGAFVISGGSSLTVSGASASLTATGPTIADESSLYVTGGATLSLPQVRSYTHTQLQAWRVFQASGAGSILDLSGVTNVAGGSSYYDSRPLSITAQSGGRVNLSGVQTMPLQMVVLLADGTNSVVDLSALTAVQGSYYYNGNSSSWEARNGGAVLLGSLRSAAGIEWQVHATGGMLPSALQALSGGVLTVDGVALTLAGVTNIDEMSLYVLGGATLSLPQVRSYTHTQLQAWRVFQASGAGSILDLSGVTNVVGGSSYYDSRPLSITAQSGGRVNLSGVQTMPLQMVVLLADGTNSVVDLSALTAVQGSYFYNGNSSSWEARNGGAVLLGSLRSAAGIEWQFHAMGTLQPPLLQALTGGGLTVDGIALTLAGVTNIDEMSFYVSGGATLSLPQVRSYTHTQLQAWRVFQASGAGSLLDLSGVTNVVGNNSYYDSRPLSITAQSGGRVNLSGVRTMPLQTVAVLAQTNSVVDLSALTTVQGSYFSVLADGTNSVVDLSALTTVQASYFYIGASTWEARNGGAVLLSSLRNAGGIEWQFHAVGGLLPPPLETLTGGGLTLDGMALTLAGVTNIDEMSFYVSGGATLSLPQVRSYTHTQLQAWRVFQASGAGSLLDLSGVTNVVGGSSYYDSRPLSITAQLGGRVNLSGVQTMPLQMVVVLADGTNSVVDLSALTAVQGSYYYNGNSSSWEARNGGAVLLGSLRSAAGIEWQFHAMGTLQPPLLQALTGGGLTVDGIALTLAGVTNIDEMNFYVTGGATLSLPQARSYAHTQLQAWRVFQASGAGSLLDLSGVTNVVGGSSYYDSRPLSITAQLGGRVNLSGMQTMPLQMVVVLADGTNSVVDLSALTAVQGSYYYNGNSSSWEARNGGAVLTSNLTSVTGITLLLNANATIQTEGLHTISQCSLFLSGVVRSFPALTGIDGSSFTVQNGAILNLTNFPTLIVSNGNLSFTANGPGSLVDLSVLASLVVASGNQVSVNAQSGGVVDLHNVESISGGSASFLANGTGSVIDLSRLTGFMTSPGASSLTAQNGGVILVGNQAFLLGNVAVNMPPGNLVLPPTVVASQALTLYGQAWHSYWVERRDTSNPASGWQFAGRVPLTNSVEAFAATVPPNTAYRVWEFVAEPPILDLSLLPGQQYLLVLYGATNKTYQVQSRADLRPPTVWGSAAVVSMTNAFRILPPAPVGPAGTRQFFRAKEQ